MGLKYVERPRCNSRRTWAIQEKNVEEYWIAVRLLYEGLDADPRISDFRVFASHKESLHSHDAISVIVKGVPAVFTILVIGFAAFQFRPRKDKDEEEKSEEEEDDKEESKAVRTAERLLVTDGGSGILRYVEIDGRMLTDHLAPGYRSSIKTLLAEGAAPLGWAPLSPSLQFYTEACLKTCSDWSLVMHAQASMRLDSLTTDWITEFIGLTGLMEALACILTP